MPVSLMFRHVEAQLQDEYRAETFRLAISPWAVPGGGNFIHPDSATQLHNDLRHKLRAYAV